MFDTGAGAVKSSGAVWGDVARVNINQTWTAAQTFNGGALVPNQSVGEGNGNVANTKYVYDFFNAAFNVTVAPLASPAFTGNPTAPTPSAGDNDTSIATTAFVQGELNSPKVRVLASPPIQNYSANVTLAKSDTGSIIRLSSGTTFITTLPDNGTGTQPCKYYIFNASTVPQTLKVAANNYIYSRSGVSASGGTYTIAPKGAVAVYAANWDWHLIENPPLGSAALLNVGTSAGQVVQLDGSARLPAVDGSQLTNVNAAAVPVRQTVLSGPAASGLPNFLPATSGSLSLTSQNISTGSAALVVTAANGFGASGAANVIGMSTTNLTWSGLAASTTVYLGVTISGGALTPFSTTLEPVYQRGGTISTTNGQYTFDIVAMQMYLGNGSVANPVNAVFVGEVVTGASSVTSTIAYAYQGIYVYDDTGSLPGAGTNVAKNHNIGVNADVVARLRARCVTAELGYSVGDMLDCPHLWGSAAAASFEVATRKNVVTFTTGSTYAGWHAVNLSTGATSTTGLTLARWRYQIRVERGW
ncbi:hypothetical protein C5L14_23275 [Labrys okinawensis]|uniref:Uncharacterized protein n=1 Tax=Labrys okinawensis TaxID=346911 RepID=A0A2S9Q7Q1_9HYPH|nr:hypothetical protein C5L14_23275 [Labrys okinawensis]